VFVRIRSGENARLGRRAGSGITEQKKKPDGMPVWKRHIGLKEALVAFSAALIVAFGGILLQSSDRTHRQIAGDAEARAESMVRSAELSTARTIRSIDAMLAEIAQSLAADRDAPIDGPEIQAMLRQMNERVLSIRDILVIDEAGHRVNGGAPVERSRSPADRSFVTAHVGPEPSDLYIGRPERSGEAGWSLFLSRALTLPGGFRGVIAAEVPVQTFADNLAAISGSGLRIALLSDDGSLITSEPSDALSVGAQDRVSAAILAHLRQAPSAMLELPTSDGREPDFVTYRTVAGRPLIVAVIADKERLLASWRDERRWSIIMIAMIAFAIGSLTWGLVRLLRRRQQHLQELRRNEAKFVQQSALLQSTLEHMGEGLSVFDRNHRLLAWNDRFISLLALPSGVGHGTRFEDILRLQARRGDFGAVDIEDEVRARLGRVRSEIEQTTERTTLGGRTLEIRRRRMPSGGFVTLYSDVTERRRFEEEIIEARNQAEIANRSKGEFLANMSHELRTPLNAIIGFSDILKNERFGAVGNLKYLEYARDIHTSGVHLLDLISDVLDMSKIEAGKLELFEEEVAIPELVNSCLSMVRERARERRVRIAADLSTQVGLLWVDRRAMKQILLNILSNAVKFSHDSGAVTITARPSTDGGTFITVRDAGIGMTEEQIERSRQPFGQAHAATTRSYGGTGLGLTITQRLVELHGGVLQIESRPGEGTAVSVILPPSRSQSSMKQTA
jgi:signal transduction histidine kinase